MHNARSFGTVSHFSLRPTRPSEGLSLLSAQLHGSTQETLPHQQTCCFFGYSTFFRRAKGTADACAGLLRVLVDGKHVLSGGHKLALDVPEHCQVAFLAPDACCRAGEAHTALVQLLDGRGFQLQVSLLPGCRAKLSVVHGVYCAPSSSLPFMQLTDGKEF